MLIGHLGNDPEIKVFESGSTLARFSMATNESYVDDEGHRITNTLWHNLIAWGKVAEICGQLLKKGSEVVIEGKLLYRSYQDAAGVKKLITEIQVNEMLLVGGKSSGKAEEVDSSSTDNELVILDK